MTTASDVGNGAPQRRIVDRIGILLVHGIGDQNKNEHLQNVAKNLVKAASILFTKKMVNVELFPGVDGTSELSILIQISRDQEPKFICVDLHEVWWRDLSQSPSPLAVIRFWMWAATFFGTKGRFRPATIATVPPKNSATEIGRILWTDRFLLFIKITYFFVLLFPVRIAVQLVNILPGIRPINLFRTIFSYMSSVQIYQQRSGRKGGTLVDFDQSLRISIQRRFANALIAMAERPYSRWYIMAHSLGSIIALKGLMYHETAFARFLGYNRWHDRRFNLRVSDAEDVGDYPDRPFKPAWLGSSDGVSVGLMLERCRGFISWGSPLETFARTWPEMVHVRTCLPVMKEFEWINLYDPVDVVSSSPLKSFDHVENFGPTNIPCRSSLGILSAHTSYFESVSYFEYFSGRRNRRIGTYILQWILHPENSFEKVADNYGWNPLGASELWRRRCVALTQWVLVLMVGVYSWPVATGLFVKVLGFLPRQIAMFIAPGSRVVDDFFGSLETKISELAPNFCLGDDSLGDCLVNDIYRGLKVLLIVGSVLAVGGILHYLGDAVAERFARKDRLTGNLDIATAEYSDTEK